jgi:hypothetical protein
MMRNMSIKEMKRDATSFRSENRMLKLDELEKAESILPMVSSRLRIQDVTLGDAPA